MSIYTVILILLILALIGAFPTGGYGGGLGVHSTLGLLVLILVILLLAKVI